MENLNAELIKKALECWASGKPCEGGVCDLFDASTFTCDRWTGKNALALINSQEQRIKELTEEKENLKIMNELCEISEQSLRDLYDADTTAQSEVISRLIEENEKLTEENEYLKQQNEIYAVLNEKMQSICDSYAFQYGTVIPKEVFLKKEREKAVKEMQERLENRFDEDGNYFGIEVHSKIDQIAKEMLEGENEGNFV